MGGELGAERDGIEVGGELDAEREASGEWGAWGDGERWAICGLGSEWWDLGLGLSVGALGVGELGPFGGACVCGELGAFECGVCGAWVGGELGAEVTGYPRWVVSWMPSVRPRVSGVPGAMVSVGPSVGVLVVGSGVPSGVPWGWVSLGPSVVPVCVCVA